MPNDEIPARDSQVAVVSRGYSANDDGWFLTVLGDLYRTLLYFCLGLGTQGVHYLLDLVHRVHYFNYRHRFHLCRVDVLSVGGGGPRVVVAIGVLRMKYGDFHSRVLLLLLRS